MGSDEGLLDVIADGASSGRRFEDAGVKKLVMLAFCIVVTVIQLIFCFFYYIVPSSNRLPDKIWPLSISLTHEVCIYS